MAIKNIIAKGIGFSPSSVKFMPTHGFDISEAVASIWVEQSPAPADTWVKEEDAT